MAKKKKENTIPFEEALQQLESIVQELENDTPDLEVALNRYEEGLALANTCQKKLDEAELRIQTLQSNA